MSRENEAVIARVFHEVVDQPPHERPAFLDRACKSDAALRARVEELLAAMGMSDNIFLPRSNVLTDDAVAPATVDDAAAARPSSREQPGSHVGRYKLLQLIGEGGFGSVFMAEQEHPVKRRVALKIIKPGMDTKQVIARFEAERQALAMMDHPNIAKVFDAGETSTGRPYFVMELVKGKPITEYCDENKLDTRSRLELFTQVCRAVQHAHQKAIIHRDIKPSNVLVSVTDEGKPVPKVIDFGIAKATQAKLTEKTLFTEFHQFIGTPEYMSPEQAEMGPLDIDTRSDVYSLGVLLYELLTGTTPFDSKRLRDAAYREIQRIIREVEPPRPSTRLNTMPPHPQSAVAARRGTDATKLGRLLHGDLDWVVMKCLEKDRTRRYDSARDAAADIERYLVERPVEAGPPRPWYRARKFLRRRRRECVALTLLFALAASTVTAFAFHRRWVESQAAAVRATEWREESDLVERIIAGADLAPPERKRTDAALERLGRRVLSLDASPTERDLLARFLTRDVGFRGRSMQVLDNPSVDFEAALRSDYGLGGIGIVIRPSVALAGRPVPLLHFLAMLRPGSGHSGISSSLPLSLSLAGQLPGPGTYELSGTLEAQFFRGDADMPLVSGLRDMKGLRLLSDPLVVHIPTRQYTFVREMPPEYPIAIQDSAAAGVWGDALRATARWAGGTAPGERLIELSIEFPLPPIPVAAKVTTSFATSKASLPVIDFVADAGGVRTDSLSGVVDCATGFRGDGAFITIHLLPSTAGVVFDAEAATFLAGDVEFASSREVALSHPEVEHFLTFSFTKPLQARSGRSDDVGEARGRTGE